MYTCMPDFLNNTLLQPGAALHEARRPESRPVYVMLQYNMVYDIM